MTLEARLKVRTQGHQEEAGEAALLKTLVDLLRSSGFVWHVKKCFYLSTTLYLNAFLIWTVLRFMTKKGMCPCLKPTSVSAWSGSVEQLEYFHLTKQ